MKINQSGILDVGDRFSLDVPDRSKFRRFLHWILRRPPPVKRQYFVVTHGIDPTSFKVGRAK